MHPFPTPADSPYLPVLLVHGFTFSLDGFTCDVRGGGTDTWGQTASLLTQAGVDVWEFQYIAGDFLYTSAGLLKQALGEMANHIQQNNINIIAHSQGGLVVRYFLKTPCILIHPFG